MENIIIEKYKTGISSLKIAKDLKISKHKVLEILNKHNLIRKKDRCSKLNIIQKNDKFSISRKCPKCNNIIETVSKEKIIACRNHFKKINNKTLCKKCSLELQVGPGNPFYGKKHKKESIEKISNNRKNKTVGDKNPMSNPVWKEKARINLIKKWESGELEDLRLFMSNKLKETRGLGKLKSVCVSKKELKIKKEIEDLGFEVIGSFVVGGKICDIFIPKLNLIIEYNGDYWHCNPKKYSENYFNKKKNKTAKEIWKYDNERIDLIKSFGYTLEVVWESELKSDNKIIKKIINKYVNRN